MHVWGQLSRIWQNRVRCGIFQTWDKVLGKLPDLKIEVQRRD